MTNRRRFIVRSQRRLLLQLLHSSTQILQVNQWVRSAPIQILLNLSRDGLDRLEIGSQLIPHFIGEFMLYLLVVLVEMLPQGLGLH